MGAGGAAAYENAENPLGCLRIRNHCPPTDDFVQLLCQSSLPASKDACAAFPCTSPKSRMASLLPCSPSKSVCYWQMGWRDWCLTPLARCWTLPIPQKPTADHPKTAAPLGCLRIRNHCPPTDDFVQLLCQSSLPASKDACAAFPCTSPKSPGGGCVAVLARRFLPRVPWKGRVEYWMYFQALYRVLWGKSLSQNQCFLIWRQPYVCPFFVDAPSG